MKADDDHLRYAVGGISGGLSGQTSGKFIKKTYENVIDTFRLVFETDPVQ